MQSRVKTGARAGAHRRTRIRRPLSLEAPSDVIACGPVWVSPYEMCEVRVGGYRAPMPITHMRMLVALLAAGGSVLSRDELYESSGSGELPEGSRRVDVTR